MTNSNLAKNVGIGIISGVFIIVSIEVLYRRWKRNGRRQKTLDSLHKVEEESEYPDGNKFAPLAEDAPQSDPPSSLVSNSEEADLGHTLDDDRPARSNMLLRPVPALHPTAPVPRYPHIDRDGVPEPEPELSVSFVTPAPFLLNAPISEIPLDQVQFSRHPRPNITTRMK